MTVLLTLLVGITAVGALGHRPLLWAADRRTDPTVLLTGWILTCVGLVVAALATVVSLAFPLHAHRSPGLFRLAGDCLAAISAGTVPGARETLAALGLATATAVLVRLLGAVLIRTRARRARAPHLAQLRLLAGPGAPHEPLWIRDDRPLAVSVSGRPGVILMSDTLRRHLTPAAVAATLEHERAHLRGRHHLLVAIVRALADVSPSAHCSDTPRRRSRTSRSSPQTPLLPPRCGPAAGREALSRLTGQPSPALGLAMATHLVQMRLARLSSGTADSRLVARAAGCLAVATGALVLPLSAGLSAFDVIGCIAA